MAALILVRHGEAEGNGDHRFIGQSEMPLTEEGRRQSGLVADRLAHVPITRIVASDLSRTMATMEPLAERLGLPVEPEPRLREIANGEWTGLLPGEIESRWPEMWVDYVSGIDVARPGGERWADVSARVVPVAEELLAGEGIVAVGAHGGPILIMALWAVGVRVEGNIFRGPLAALNNTSVTVIDPGPRLAAFNDVGHLGAALDLRLPF